MLASVRMEKSAARIHPLITSLVLTRYLPKTKIRKERKLLQDNVEGVDGQQEPEVRSRSPLTVSLL
jgi:hypothetical protein